MREEAAVRLCGYGVSGFCDGLAGVVAYPSNYSPFSWCPNTGLWHLDGALCRDILHKDFPLVELSVEQVLVERAEFRPWDLRDPMLKEELENFLAAPARDVMCDAQVGIPVQPGERPLSGLGVRNWLGKLEVGESVPVALYPYEQKRAAQVLASDIRLGRRRSLAGWNWGSQVVAIESGWLVIAEKGALARSGCDESPGSRAGAAA